MAFKRGKPSRNGDEVAKRAKDRRSGEERRGQARPDSGPAARVNMRELYKTDLDRHLWSWGKKSSKKGRKGVSMKKVLGAAAGILGAAGLTFWAYKRLKSSDEQIEDDPRLAQAGHPEEEEEEEEEEEGEEEEEEQILG